MNNMLVRRDIIKGDTIPAPVGAAYKALLLSSGEAQLVHDTDTEALQLEQHLVNGMVLHARGTPFTMVRFNLLQVENPVAFADKTLIPLLQPFLTSERAILVKWLRVNLDHLKSYKL